MVLAPQTNPMADKLKLAVAALVLVVAGVGFYWFSTTPLVARVGIVLAGVVVAVAIGWTSDPGKQFYAYFQAAITETKKVVWPSRKETVQTTAVVVAFVIIMAAFLWAVDTSLGWFVNMLVRRES